jgi:hypothetical protein
MRCFRLKRDQPKRSSLVFVRSFQECSRFTFSGSCRIEVRTDLDQVFLSVRIPGPKVDFESTLCSDVRDLSAPSL